MKTQIKTFIKSPVETTESFDERVNTFLAEHENKIDNILFDPGNLTYSVHYFVLSAEDLQCIQRKKPAVIILTSSL